MEPELRNFTALKSAKFDEEALQTNTSEEQVSFAGFYVAVCGFIYIPMIAD